MEQTLTVSVIYAEYSSGKFLLQFPAFTQGAARARVVHHVSGSNAVQDGWVAGSGSGVSAETATS